MNERQRDNRTATEGHGQRAEGQEKIAEAMALLEQGIESILDSEGFAVYLKTMARFHTYSFNNVALIMAQRPEATQVAGYRAWQGMGRQVRKGEKSIVVFVPHRRRVKRSADTEAQVQGDGEQEPRATQTISGFGLGRVFDIAQTEGEALPEPPEARELAGTSQAGDRIERRLSHFLIGEGVRLSREDTGCVRGYYRPGERLIVVSERLSGDDRTKTLVHEAAHYLADHRGRIDRADAETIAESSAFVVLAHYGIDASEYSFPYVARWAEDKAVLRRNLSEVQGVAAGLIAGIEDV